MAPWPVLSGGKGVLILQSQELVALFEQALAEKWGYIWGKRGQTWTKAAQSAATRPQTRQHGAKWIGHRVADCSGLFVWAYGVLGERIYHGSNTIFRKYLSNSGALTHGIELPRGAAVFKKSGGRRTHIGLYTGSGMCIEAHSTRQGVIRSSIGDWDEWGSLAAADYTDAPTDIITLPHRTLRRGCRGDDVRELQALLAALGFDLGKAGADGIFGSMTHQAVLAYQRTHSLQADGIVGPQTWAALERA